MAYINGKETFYGVQKVGATLSPIEITENGVYYPAAPFGFGKVYTFKNSYTQEELQALADLGDNTAFQNISYLYKHGAAYVCVLSSASSLSLAYCVSTSEIYTYCDEGAAESIGGDAAAGWNCSKNGSSYINMQFPPSITFDEAGTVYITDLSALPILFNVCDCEGFGEISVNVEGAALVPLTVTENGTYYPKKNVETDTTYIFKSTYTQEELKTLYDLSSTKSTDGMYAYLYLSPYTSEDVVMVGVAYLSGLYGVYLSNGFVWIPEAFASQIGSSEGWQQGADLSSLTKADTVPTFWIGANGEAFVEDITALNPLFELPFKNGFSEVVVNVAGSASADIVNVTFIGEDGSVLYVKPCIIGDDCNDVYKKGIIEKPTKASTAQYNYTYSGWSLTEGGAADSSALSDVTEERTVYAAFSAAVRYYTVRFFDGETILKTESVAYGGTATPPDSEKGSGYIFEGWTPSNFTITADTDFYGTWKESVKLEAYTWTEIADMAESGEAANKFFIGDTKDIVFIIPNSSASVTIPVQIVAFNHDNLSDGSGKAGITFMSTRGFPTKVKPATSTSSSRECWTTLPLLRNETKKIFSVYVNEEVSSRIKTVNKITTRYTSSTEKENITSQETVWIPSSYEIYLRGNPDEEKYALFANGESIFIGQDYWLRNGSSSHSKLYMVPKDGSGLLERSITTTADLRWGFCL